MNKLLLGSIMLCCITLPGLATADDSVIETPKSKIYTEGFVVVNPESQASNLMLQNVKTDAIGNVGTLKVLNGTRSKKIVAFVKRNNGSNYLITNTILVKCQEGTTCVPGNYEVEQIGTSSLYNVKVSNYAEWKNAIDTLGNEANVLNVAPGYEYGLKKALR